MRVRVRVRADVHSTAVLEEFMPIYTVMAESIGTPPEVVVFEQNSHAFEGFLM